MPSAGKQQQTSFQNKEMKNNNDDASPGISGAVASAVDTSVAAVAQVGNAVLSHIPGTDEHVLHQVKKDIERTGVDYHVADGEPMPRQQKYVEKAEGDEARKLHKTTSIHPGC
jgi:microcompartment protein CcmL/EutN